MGAGIAERGMVAGLVARWYAAPFRGASRLIGDEPPFAAHLAVADPSGTVASCASRSVRLHPLGGCRLETRYIGWVAIRQPCRRSLRTPRLKSIRP